MAQKKIRAINPDVRATASKIKNGKPQTVKRGKMTFTVVTSSNLKGYFYEPSTKVLSIIFNNNRVYAFARVPQIIVTGLANANSKGVFFSSKIRHKFTNVEITP